MQDIVEQHDGLIRIDGEVWFVEAAVVFAYAVFCTFPLGKNHLTELESDELGQQLGAWMLKRGEPRIQVIVMGKVHINNAISMLDKYQGNFEKQADLFAEIFQKISRKSWYDVEILKQIVYSLKKMMSASGGNNNFQSGIIKHIEMEELLQ